MDFYSSVHKSFKAINTLFTVNQTTIVLPSCNTSTSVKAES